MGRVFKLHSRSRQRFFNVSVLHRDGAWYVKRNHSVKPWRKAATLETALLLAKRLKEVNQISVHKLDGTVDHVLTRCGDSWERLHEHQPQPYID